MNTSTFLKILLIFVNFPKISGIFSDAYIDMRFLLKSQNECIFFPIHQPLSQMDIEVSTLKSEYPLSIEILSPSGKSVAHSGGAGRHYIKYPKTDGISHEIGDFQVCISTNLRQIMEVSLIIVIYEKIDKNIDVARNLHQKMEISNETLMFFENFEKIMGNIEEKLKIMKAEQSKRAFVERIDRSHIETAFEMLNFWHILRIFAVFFIAGFQVHAIRSILSVKKF